MANSKHSRPYKSKQELGTNYVPNVFGYDDLTDPQPKKSAKKKTTKTKTKYTRCPHCLGNGFIEGPRKFKYFRDEDDIKYVTCPTCKGKKKLPAKSNTKKKTTSAKKKIPKRITCPKCEGLKVVPNPHQGSELPKHKHIKDLNYITCSKCQGNGRITVINKKKRKKPNTKMTKQVEKEEELPPDNPFKFIKLD